MWDRLRRCPPIVLFCSLRRTCTKVGVSRCAAALSYYLILTLFPLLLCVHQVLGWSHLSPDSFFRPLSTFLPPGAFELLRDYLSYVSESASPALFWAGLAAIFFSASASLRTLLHVMDVLYRGGRHVRGRFFSSLALSALFLLTIYLSVTVIFTGEWFFLFLERHLTVPLHGLISFSELWNWLRYLLLFCIVLLLVLILYRAGTPYPGVSHWTVLCASVLTAVSIVICSALFSWFLGLSSRYSLVYGSLAGLIVLLVWLYFCGHILLLGAVITRCLSSRQ